MFEKVQEFDQFAKNNSLPISYHIKRTNILQDLITLIFYFVKCVNRVVFVRIRVILGAARADLYGADDHAGVLFE
jgi:hypothetical protein